ncbi:MAG: M28 family peptidase [bacterium]
MLNRSKNRLSVILLGGLLFLFTIPRSLAALSPYDHFVDFCRIGERVPGTPGHEKARDYIIGKIDSPVVDSFYARGSWFYNIYKRFPGNKTRIGIAAHWDSDIGCPGANDGGSGVAVLLSLIDTLVLNPSEMTVDIIFFDGEDVDKAALLGSNYFASKCIDNYSFILILDMIGDKDLQIFQEGHSATFFPGLVDSIWRIGMEVAPTVFMPAIKYYIIDDHYSLIKYGIRAIDIIDFDYPYWDSADDTMDKCSKESLETMYQFALRIVYPEFAPGE